MNETIFFAHTCLVALFALLSLRLGKEILISWIALQAVLANFFVVKQIELFTLTVTCSDVFAIGGILGLNLLQEYFGKAEAKKVVAAAFMAMLCFGVMRQLHLAYSASSYDRSHSAFEVVLAATPRVLTASFVTFFIVQSWDIWFFGWLKQTCARWPLWMRTTGSLLLSQLLDTTLFSFLGLYGIVASVGSIILFSYAVKLIVIAAMVPFTSLSRRFIRGEALGAT